VPAKRAFANINLTPKDEFDSSVVGKSLKWALTAGKSIVILTEFVVILAFLSRFKLDRDLNDLNEEISQKQLVVDSFSQVETQMREVQARLAIVKKVDLSSLDIQEYMSFLTTTTPKGISLSNLDLSVDRLNMKGQSGSEAGFARLIAELNRSGRFSSIDVGKTEFNPRAGVLVFDVTAKNKEETK